MNRPDFSVADLGELDTLITTDIAGAYFPTIGEIVTTTITPSAPLAAPVTNLMMAVAQ